MDLSINPSIRRQIAAGPARDQTPRHAWRGSRALKNQDSRGRCLMPESSKTWLWVLPNASWRSVSHIIPFSRHPTLTHTLLKPPGLGGTKHKGGEQTCRNPNQRKIWRKSGSTWWDRLGPDFSPDFSMFFAGQGLQGSWSYEQCWECMIYGNIFTYTYSIYTSIWLLPDQNIIVHPGHLTPNWNK